MTLTAYKKEGFTYVSVQDDGRGLDYNRIRQTAVERGLVSPAAASGLSTQDCYALVMQPGFSTASEATEISGRGVGMDVVKATVEELGGEVLIESSLGQGSIFTYKIPQLSAVNITDALIIRADEDFYAVPIGNVVATQAFQPEELHTAMGAGECIVYLGSIIPLHDLKQLLDGSRLQETTDAIPVIIIEAKNGRIALKVSEFIRPQKLVLIPLPEIFDVTGISGTTILGGNQLGMVLESFELINRATGKTRDNTEDLFLSRARVAIDDEAAVDEAIARPVTAAIPDGAVAGPQAEETGDEGPGQDMDGKLAEEFFIEIQNILTELNEDIFQLEKDPENISRVNVIFRHFHSIKGNLIMTGFNTLGGFVHQVETVLDRMRDKELAVNQEIIDLLLDAVKSLEQAVSAIRAGRSFDVTDEDLLFTLEKYRRKETAAPVEPEDEYEGAFQPSALGQLLLHAKMAQDANIFQSMMRLSPKFQEPFLVAYLILKRMALLGDVIDTIPKLDKIENGLVTSTIKVLFATRYNQDEVNRFFREQLVKHYDVVEFDNLLME